MQERKAEASPPKPRPAESSRWLITTGAMPDRDKPCYFRRLCQYFCFCALVHSAAAVSRPLARSREPFFISFRRFPFETFRVIHGILWGWQQLIALSSPLCIVRLC